MVTEVLVPTAIEASSNFAGAIGDIDEDISWSPLEFPSLTGWWDAADLSGQSDDTDVTAWDDKSGNSHGWAQRASGNLPTKVTRNGFTAVHFAPASTQSLAMAATLATMYGSTGFMALVFELDGAPATEADALMYDANNAGTGGDQAGFFSNSTGTAVVASQWDGSVPFKITFSSVSAARHLILQYHDGSTTLTASLDGGSESTLTVGTPAVTSSPMTLGAYLGSGTGWGKFWAYEAVMATANGVAGDRTALITYLKTKYGIT